MTYRFSTGYMVVLGKVSSVIALVLSIFLPVVILLVAPSELGFAAFFSVLFLANAVVFGWYGWFCRVELTVDDTYLIINKAMKWGVATTTVKLTEIENLYRSFKFTLALILKDGRKIKLPSEIEALDLSGNDLEAMFKLGPLRGCRDIYFLRLVLAAKLNRSDWVEKFDNESETFELLKKSTIGDRK